MSTVKAHICSSISGLNFATQTISVENERSIWRANIVQVPNSLNSNVSYRHRILGTDWTCAESSIIRLTAIPRRAYEFKALLVGDRGKVAGSIEWRPACKTGRFFANPVHHVFSTPPRRHCSFPASICDTRLFYGYYLGPGYGYGGGFGNGSVLLLIVLGFIAVQAFQSLVSGSSEGGLMTRSREKVSVLKLQVGLLGFARTLQSDLERISDRADTSTSRGLHYVLTETVLALLRQPDMCILGTSMAEVKRSIEAGERRFNQLSLEERGKFDEETLVNVDGNRKRGQQKSNSDGFRNEYIVVTVLVAAEGDYTLPAIYDNNDLKEALKKLGSIPADNIQGVEILWTPQDKADTLSEGDLLRNYPLLKSL